MTTTLNPGEESQLLQTIEMFEVITQSQPQDYQSLEILKEAYLKLAREEDVVQTSRRIAQAYVHLGQLSSAILEYESILQRRPDDADVLAALGEIESKASSLSDAAPAIELLEPADLVQPTQTVFNKNGAGQNRLVAADIDEGRATKPIEDDDFHREVMTPGRVGREPKVRCVTLVAGESRFVGAADS